MHLDLGAFRAPGRVSALFAALLLAACADDAPNANPPKLYDITQGNAVVREAAKAVVRIQHPAGLSGTGSFISRSGLMLTNNHVLGTEECAREGCHISLSFDHQRGEAATESGDVFAVPVHVDVGLDMAVLQVYLDEAQERKLATPDFLSFNPRDSKELLGEHVTAIGHPLGRLKKWSSGVVIDAEGEWFESSVFSLPGSSGSPIVDDQGELVGLLHRGTDGFDLLTRTSSQVSAVASSSAELDAAMDAPLPATLISVLDDLTDQQVVAHSDVFLANGTLEARVAGVPKPILDVLAAACDVGLAREDYTSLEELMEALSPCSAALDFIECRSDLGAETDVKTSCPDDRDAWVARMKSVVQRQIDFNGALDLSPVSFGIEALQRTESAGKTSARQAIMEALDEAQPVYDFTLAPYLSAFGVREYGGQETVDLIEHYKRFPFYERYAWEITLSALWLYSNDDLDRKTALGVTKELYRSDKVSIGAKLRIEEILYNSDEL